MSKERSHHLPSESVAKLDPFNRFKQPARKDAEGLLASFVPRSEKQEMNILIEQEHEAWFDVLGAEIDIKPLPGFVTPEVRRNLETHGLGLRYIPALDLAPDRLRAQNTDEYLEHLVEKYPNWKPYDSLDRAGRADHSVSRNFDHEFWRLVKAGNIDFPHLSGQWVAVETIEKPDGTDLYDRTLIGDKLGFAQRSRFDTSWSDIVETINEKNSEITADLGLAEGDGEISLLEILEWNLLANREGWGKSVNSEWTNTEYYSADVRAAFNTGDYAYGGAAEFDYRSISTQSSVIGFRVAVVLRT